MICYNSNVDLRQTDFTEDIEVERKSNIPESELARQQEFMEKIREINEDFYKKTGRRKKMHITTFGCPTV